MPHTGTGRRHHAWTDDEIVRDVVFVASRKTQKVFVPDDLGTEDALDEMKLYFSKKVRRS